MNTFMKTASSLTLIAALSAAPIAGMAQTATEEGDQAETTEMETDTDATTTETVAPEAEAEMVEETEAEVEMEEPEMTEGGDAAAPAADPAMTDTAEMDEEPAAKPVEGQITMQSDDTILANDLIGSSVYSQSGDSIGEINDLIVSLDGGVEGVVIGVGGFLGLGEKDVAVEMASLSVSAGDDEELRLMTSATREDLEAAEAFMTNEEQENARAAMETAPAADTTGGMADPAATDGAIVGDPAAEEAETESN